MRPIVLCFIGLLPILVSCSKNTSCVTTGQRYDDTLRVIEAEGGAENVDVAFRTEMQEATERNHWVFLPDSTYVLLVTRMKGNVECVHQIKLGPKGVPMPNKSEFNPQTLTLVESIDVSRYKAKAVKEGADESGKNVGRSQTEAEKGVK
jgi:hypothetical protein